MDSQDNALQEGMVDEGQKKAEPVSEVQNVESKPAEDAEPAVEVPVEEEMKAPEETEETPQEDEKKIYASKQEVLDRVKEIAAKEDNPDKKEVDTLKSLFYKFHIAEREQRQNEYLEAGGDPEKYQFVPDLSLIHI